MIVEALINLLFLPISGILSLLPDISFTVKADMFTKFLEVLRLVGYVFPMKTVAAVLGLTVSLAVLRIMIALVRFVRSMLPF